MRTTLGYPASGFVEAAAAFAFDAVSNATLRSSLTGLTNPLQWNHTPAGIPKGILVLIATEASTVSRVSSVTYGPATLTQVALSPLLSTVGATGSVAEAFFLGTSVPTGIQGVQITLTGVTGYGSINAVALTVVGPNDSAIEDTTKVDTSGNNPTCALTIAHSSLAVGLLLSDTDLGSSVGVGTGITQITEIAVGGEVFNWAYRTALVATNSSVDWTNTTASLAYGALAVAIKST